MNPENWSQFRRHRIRIKFPGGSGTVRVCPPASQGKEMLQPPTPDWNGGRSPLQPERRSGCNAARMRGTVESRIVNTAPFEKGSRDIRQRGHGSSGDDEFRQKTAHMPGIPVRQRACGTVPPVDLRGRIRYTTVIISITEDCCDERDLYQLQRKSRFYQKCG